ncbi:hypothetical protein ACOSQ4_025309 [Xanthoceras sorbifolium]
MSLCVRSSYFCRVGFHPLWRRPKLKFIHYLVKPTCVSSCGRHKDLLVLLQGYDSVRARENRGVQSVRQFLGCCPVLVKRQLGGRIRGLIELKFCGSVYNAWDYNLGR